MAYTVVPTKADGDAGYTAAQINAWIKDNFASGIPDLMTTKGDIVASTGDNAAARVAVGANNTALLADSSQAAGIKFGVLPEIDLATTKGDILAATGADALARVGSATPQKGILIADSAQSAGVRFSAPLTIQNHGSGQAITQANGAWYELNTGVDDPESLFNATNDQFNCNKTGYYVVILDGYLQAPPAGTFDEDNYVMLGVYSSTEGDTNYSIFEVSQKADCAGAPGWSCVQVVKCDAGGYIRFWAYNYTGGTQTWAGATRCRAYIFPLP